MTTIGDWVALENNLQSVSANLSNLIDDANYHMSYKTVFETPFEEFASENLDGIPLARKPRWNTRRQSLEEELYYAVNGTKHAKTIKEADEELKENIYKPTNEELKLIQKENHFIHDTEYRDKEQQTPLQIISVQPDHIVDSKVIQYPIYESTPCTSDHIWLINASSNHNSAASSVTGDQSPLHHVEHLSAIHNYKSTKILDGVSSPVVSIKSKKKDGCGFNKKYPQRSLKPFNVFPEIVTVTETVKFDETVEKWEKIDLKFLNIGPNSIFKSEQKKLFDKFKRAQQQLLELTTDRIDIESKIFNIINSDGSLDFNGSAGYQFSQQLLFIIKIGNKEHKLVKVIMKKLEKLCIINAIGIKPNGNLLLKNFREALHELVEIKQLKAISNNSYLSQCPEEFLIINNGLDNTILTIRLLRIEMWTLKHLVLIWIKNENIKKIV